MSDEQKERRINVEDLPQAEQELTPEETKEVQGGVIMANTEGVRVAVGDVNNDNLTGANTWTGNVGVKK